MNTDLTKCLERLETRIHRLTTKVREFAAKSYYSPDQERDDDGKWSGGGGGGGGGGKKGKSADRIGRDAFELARQDINDIPQKGTIQTYRCTDGDP